MLRTAQSAGDEPCERDWIKNSIVLIVHAIANFGVPLLPPIVRIYRLAVLYLHSEPQLIIASIT